MSISRIGVSAALHVAVNALSQGKVLVCPTDTVYGLLADATNKNAIQKIFQIKGREKGKPLPIFVKDIAMAQRIARFGTSQEKYMRRVWPGKVTVVLKSRGVLPKETGTKDSIGLRIPEHKLVQLILQNANTPLTGTSANLAGQPSVSDSKEIIKQFSERKYKPDIFLDAGKLPLSRPSRVVDITGLKHKILRK